LHRSFAEPGRIRIEIVTKPGAKDFHGEFQSDYNDGWLTARNAFAAKEGSVQTRIFPGYLAGPAVPQRWSFTAYAGQWTELGSNVVNATVLDAATRGPAPFVQNVATPRTITSLWVGSDVQLARQHTLAMSYNRTGDGAENLGLAGGFDLPDRAYSRSVRENALRLSLISFFGTRLLHETRVEYAWNRRLSKARSSAPGLLVLEAFNSGGNQESRFSDSRERNVQLTDHVTLTYRQSTIKAGLQADTTNRRYDDRSGFGGTFVFGADVERDGSGNPVRSPTGETMPITALESVPPDAVGLTWQRPVAVLDRAGRSPSCLLAMVARVVRPAGLAGVASFLRLLRPSGMTCRAYAAGLGDLGPRIGVGWKSDKASKGTVRAGVGLFTSRFDTDLTLNIRRLDGIHQRSLVVARPSFFAVVPDTISGADISQLAVYRTAPDLQAPRTSMATLGYERELRQGLSASATYTYQRGVDLTRLINANAPRANGHRPSLVDGPIMQYESTGRSARHELLVGIRADLKTVSLNGNYTLARTRSDTDGPSTTPADSTDLAAEYGSAAEDQRHAAFFGASRSLPGGISVAASLTLLSGRPFNITTGRDNNGDTLFTDRPAFARPGDADAIVTPFGTFNPDTQPGDRIVPRNFGRSAGEARVDLHLAKSMKTGPAARPACRSAGAWRTCSTGRIWQASTVCSRRRPLVSRTARSAHAAFNSG
jgi:hypothetical protein